MAEQNVYLKSLHQYNFRHGIENARVIDFITFTPENLNPRPCFKVQYDSDNFIDYIPFQSVSDEHWEFV
jgi:hypothetical protein